MSWKLAGKNVQVPRLSFFPRVILNETVEGWDGTQSAGSPQQQASTGQMRGKTHSLASDKDSVPSKGNNRNVCPQNPRLQGLGSGGGLD